jgi:ankyrin repeat protein
MVSMRKRLREFQYLVETKTDSARRGVVKAVLNAAPSLAAQEALANALSATGTPKALARAIEAGADPEKSFALHQAARAGLPQLVEVLLEHCDPARLDSEGWSALRMAALTPGPSHLACVKLLAPRSPMGPDPVLAQTPLMSAAISNNPEAIEALLPFCDPKAANRDGQTALMVAAGNFDSLALAALIPHSDLGAQNARGFTALDIASHGPHRRCSQMLESVKAPRGQGADRLDDAANLALLAQKARQFLSNSPLTSPSPKPAESADRHFTPTAPRRR